jgi:hypothetical protein
MRRKSTGEAAVDRTYLPIAADYCAATDSNSSSIEDQSSFGRGSANFSKLIAYETET